MLGICLCPILDLPVDSSTIDRALLRLRKAALVAPSDTDVAEPEPIVIWLFQDLSDIDGLDRDGPAFVGEFKRWPRSKAERSIAGDTGVLNLDITGFIRDRVGSGERISFTIAVATPGARLTWGGVELAVFARDL